MAISIKSEDGKSVVEVPLSDDSQVNVITHTNEHGNEYVKTQKFKT